ncbi:MAG: hypothetical protein AB2806_21540 [Candidatus Thiodiazotropha sp.]
MRKTFDNAPKRLVVEAKSSEIGENRFKNTAKGIDVLEKKLREPG